MKTMNHRTIILLAVAISISGIMAQSEDIEENGNVRLVMKLVEECSRKDEIGICLKTKAVSFLDKLVKMKDPVPINDYLALARDPAVDNIDQVENGMHKSNLITFFEKKLQNCFKIFFPFQRDQKQSRNWKPLYREV